MKFTPGTIMMQTTVGPKTEEALISGPFAIHQTRDSHWQKVRGRWTITHAPSGRSILQNATSERAARAFCRDVARCTDWSADQPSMPVRGTEAYTTFVMARAMATPGDNAP